jgi:Transposase IS4
MHTGLQLATSAWLAGVCLLKRSFSRSVVIMPRMADSTSSTRRSTRSSQQPISLAEEQAASALSLLEQRDVAAALRLSLRGSWDSDEEESDADSDADAEASSEEEEEKKQAPSPAEQKEEWTRELHDINVPLPRLRYEQRHPPSDDTPLELLQRFLPHRLMEEFAQHTNATAPHDWRPTTAAELYAFLGVHLFMGIDRLPRTEMYWSQSFGHPLIASIFSRDRFKQLLRFFRVVAPVDDAAPRDPLPHIQSLAAKLNASFAAHSNPSQQLALDEAMAAFKGRSPIKQYIPSKPHKWGYKIYCLSSEDYLLRFQVYAGAEERSVDGATYDTVMRLLQGYEEKAHVLFTDNWFTSPALLLALQRKGIRLCGSVRRNRKGLPVIPPEEVTGLGQGQWIQRQKGDMSLAVWKDQKVVWLLYNHCSPREAASLDRWSEAGNKISIGCPKAIRDYFYQARSVDVLSQLHYAYVPGRKAMRCWPRLAWWLLDMCVINAFKLWSIGRDHPSQLDFRIQLMHQLMEQLPAASYPRKHGGHPCAPGALAKEHFAEAAGGQGDCAQCSHQSERRVRSSYVCHTCRAHLCVGECFALYHS